LKNMHQSMVTEETWVESHVEKLQSMPTATSARELDVSILFSEGLNRVHTHII
jgi:hypothetical protein